MYSYLQARLTWKWRKKLTDMLHTEYFAGINYYLVTPLFMPQAPALCRLTRLTGHAAPCF